MRSEQLRKYINILTESTASPTPITPAKVWQLMGMNEAAPDAVFAQHDRESTVRGHMLRDIVDRLINRIDSEISKKSGNVSIIVHQAEDVDKLTVTVDGSFINMLVSDSVSSEQFHKALLVLLNLYRAQGWDARFTKSNLTLSATRKH